VLAVRVALDAVDEMGPAEHELVVVLQGKGGAFGEEVGGKGVFGQVVAGEAVCSDDKGIGVVWT